MMYLPLPIASMRLVLVAAALLSSMAWAEYRLQAGDVVEISVAAIPELRECVPVRRKWSFARSWSDNRSIEQADEQSTSVIGTAAERGAGGSGRYSGASEGARQDAAVKLTAERVKLQSTEEKLQLAGVKPPRAADGSSKFDITVFRRSVNGVERLTAAADTELQPGDVVEFAAHSEQVEVAGQ
jgi:hypothetical protein